MTLEKINLMFGLFIAFDLIVVVLLARLIYSQQKSRETIKTEKIEMKGFEIKIENKELTIKPKK